MTKIQLRNLAIALGLTLYTYSPGDGITRYRFFRDHHVSDYFSGDQLFTALGCREATVWLEGFKAGKGGAA